MPSKTTLADQTSDAYEHLYDIVYLRTHPLNLLFPSESHLSRNEQAWRLHHHLLDLITQLDPGPDAPPYSREWRRHRLMVLRYVDRLDPQEVADRLGISRRSYYRECAAAVDALAELLWDRQAELADAAAGGGGPGEERQSASRLELLRLETARLALAGRQSRLSEVVQDALELVQEMAQGKGITIRPQTDEMVAEVAVARGVLRQILLGALSYLIEQMVAGSIAVSAREAEEGITLLIETQGARARPPGDAERLERLSMLNELAALQRCELLPLMDRGGIAGFSVTLPTMDRRMVLVIDDNEDVLQLFRGYLTQHDYQVVTARTGSDALDLARSLQPFAITLDLMMPLQDGWDILQTLANQPVTSHIPVIICTVLSAKELALSLGAASFLEKPVTEQALIAALSALGEA